MKKFHWSIKKYVKNNCISGKSMACFGGKNRRNVFTMDEIVRYEKNMLIFTFIYNLIIIYIQYFCNRVDSKFYFVFHNLLYVSFVDIYSVVVVPLKHLLLCNESIWSSIKNTEPNIEKSFYVRNPIFVFSQQNEKLNNQRLAVFHIDVSDTNSSTNIKKQQKRNQKTRFETILETLEDSSETSQNQENQPKFSKAILTSKLEIKQEITSLPLVEL